MDYLVIISFLVIIVIALCVFLIIRLNKWVSSNEVGAKYYTRFTMATVVISLGIVLLMLITAIMNASVMDDTRRALQAQIKGTPPIEPLIIIKLDDGDYNRFFFSSYLVDLLHLEDWQFWPRKEEIRMYARNNGQQDSGTINFYLMDEKKQFNTESINTAIKSFDFEYLEFLIWHKNCSYGKGKEEFMKANKKCDHSELPTGKMKWYLKMDCPACLGDVNPKCYSFNICVYNVSQQEDWCKLQWDERDGELIPIECPQDWEY